MKTVLTAIIAAALIAMSAQAKASPRGIDECEKIQAADAYNLCLASFGPVPRGHHGFSDGAGKQIETASQGSHHVVAATASRTWHGHRHAFRHGSSRHHFAHSTGHRTRAVLHRSKHGNKTTIAFSVISSPTRLR